MGHMGLKHTLAGDEALAAGRQAHHHHADLGVIRLGNDISRDRSHCHEFKKKVFNQRGSRKGRLVHTW